MQRFILAIIFVDNEPVNNNYKIRALKYWSWRMENQNEKKVTFQSVGNIELLSREKIIILSSQDIPQELAKRAEALFSELRKQAVALCGGWQSAMEKRLFKQAATRDSAGYIHYLARNLNSFAPNEQQQTLIDAGKLLLLAPEIKQDRAVSALVDKRDNLMLSQVRKVILLYVRSGGRIEEYIKHGVFESHEVFILDHAENRAFFSDDMVVIDEAQFHWRSL